MGSLAKPPRGFGPVSRLHNIKQSDNIEVMSLIRPGAENPKIMLLGPGQAPEIQPDGFRNSEQDTVKLQAEV
jgi:hypothetical protein